MTRSRRWAGSVLLMVLVIERGVLRGPWPVLVVRTVPAAGEYDELHDSRAFRSTRHRHPREYDELHDSRALRSTRRARREGDVIHVACLACGHDFVRDPEACPQCGGPMIAVRVPLLHKARGTQQSILAYRMQQRCVDCEGPPPELDGSATLDR